jgi:uncharacterized protein (TIGR00255 family)
MIFSMTGYGDARAERPGMEIVLEIRSLNARYFKATVKLPEWLGFLESDVEKMLRRRITRGTVAYSLKVRAVGEGGAQEVNVQALHSYLRQLSAVSLPESAGVRPTVDLATLMLLPGVCRPREETLEDPDEWRGVVESLTERALDRLTTMRRTEGQAVWADLERQCRIVSEQLEAVAARAPGVVADYALRLRERVNGLLAGSSLTLGQDDLIREVSIFAERCDISEEISRLRGHIEQFLATGRAGSGPDAETGSEAAGRKLEFLGQEMLREANTIGSKANDSELLRRIVEIKGAVDRIKEQVQNVE